MNLWTLFQDLLHIEGILSLPKFVFPLYLYLLYALIKQHKYRQSLGVFLLLSILASVTMVLSLKPGSNTFFPPLMLLVVMLMPLIMLILQALKKVGDGIVLWAICSVAGGLHSLSWLVWFSAMAQS